MGVALMCPALLLHASSLAGLGLPSAGAASGQLAGGAECSTAFYWQSVTTSAYRLLPSMPHGSCSRWVCWGTAHPGGYGATPEAYVSYKIYLSAEEHTHTHMHTRTHTHTHTCTHTHADAHTQRILCLGSNYWQHRCFSSSRMLLDPLLVYIDHSTPDPILTHFMPVLPQPQHLQVPSHLVSPSLVCPMA